MDLVGVIYLTKGLIGANLEPGLMTGWSQEKRGSEVGLIRGVKLWDWVALQACAS